MLVLLYLTPLHDHERIDLAFSIFPLLFQELILLHIALLELLPYKQLPLIILFLALLPIRYQLLLGP